ncbi:TolC family protein [Sphingomonas sp. BK235]|uniref:efflux transporter outer membrane subunit n=1 Tax=Sphingomonas sp. BK235 TaxID=2512131 RepID=UPI00104740BB|nr:TolC family protein [Sphingomonas sp. BK235]TCP32800.1 NodT family efflux transporter outer membrane factor (OMF) lipoprotein [Sphingomonas sp. BK235]
MRTSIPVLLLGASLAACAAGPDYAPPAIPATATGAFVGKAPDVVAEGEPETRWWRLYDDPRLDAIVATALAHNADLRVAVANLSAAEAVLAEARDGRMPQTAVAASSVYGRRQPPLFLGGDRLVYGGGAQLSYEADLVGRVARTIEAARADAEAEAFARAAVQVRIVSAVTGAYLSACTAAQAAAVIRSSIALATERARIVDRQERAGSLATLDVARAEAQLAETRAQLAPVENARAAALFELAALSGLSPAQVPQEAARCDSPPEPQGPIRIGDGASLLRRRPDVAQAERRLAAATARIGVAVADLYPRLTIGGNLSRTGGDGIGAGRGFAFGIGPALSLSFPHSGAARARVRQARGRAEAALAVFDGTIVTALKEVEQALAADRAAIDRQAALAASERRADQAFRLADQRYRAGSIAYIDSLVAQGELVRLRLARTEADRAVAFARVDLFRALGSGQDATDHPRIDLAARDGATTISER